jgi:Cupredoxin-like domain
VLVLAPILAIAAPIGGQEASYSLIIKDHKFQPSDIEIPAGKRITLVFKNSDPTPEEFENTELRREKMVQVVPGDCFPECVRDTNLRTIGRVEFSVWSRLR